MISRLSRLSHFAPLAVQIAVVGLVVWAWHSVTSNGSVPELLLPAPGKVLIRFAALVTDPSSFGHIKVTAGEFAAAMALSLVAGLTVGVLTGTVKWFGEFAEPIILAIYAVPVIMVFPLCILYFGVGPGSKIVFAGLSCVFPIAIQTMKGIRQVEPGVIRAARSMGARRWQMAAKVLVPASFPAVITGLRLAAVLCLLATIAGEMIAAMAGIGSEISRARGNFDSVGLYAWILLVMLFVAVISGGLAWLDRLYSDGA